MSDFPSSVLIACSCGFAAEGRLRTTCEGARFWFGRCVGCGRDVMAKAPSSLPGAPATSSAAAPFHVLSASTGPRGASPPPPPPARPLPRLTVARAKARRSLSLGSAKQVSIMSALDRLSGFSAWSTLALAAAFVALRLLC